VNVSGIRKNLREERRRVMEGSTEEKGLQTGNWRNREENTVINIS
jgi:hypothetical protein